jgi:hypothetical protein
VKVNVFYPSHDEELTEVLYNFSQGIPGAQFLPLGEYVPCDVAVIFGSVKEAIKTTYPKREIMERHQGRSLIMVEAGFLKRNEYYQIGFGGFAGNADFRNKNSPSDRWKKMNTPILPWKKNNSGKVIVCGQLRRDTQVQYEDHALWCRNTIKKLQLLNQDVLFRPHPREKNPSVYGVDSSLYNFGPLSEVLHKEKVKCVVTWNSTSGVDSLLSGVPVIAMHNSSIVYPIAQHQIKSVNNLSYPFREQFFNDLGYAMWTKEEMKQGLPWNHLMRKV